MKHPQRIVQIREAAQKQFPHEWKSVDQYRDHREGFEVGANWADANPFDPFKMYGMKLTLLEQEIENLKSIIAKLEAQP